VIAIREQTINRILNEKIIAILRGIYGEECLRLADALRAGGISLIEVTFDQARPENHKSAAEAIRALGARFGEDVLAGAGTVMSEAQLEAAAEAGARYIISPDANPKIIRATRDMGLVSLPGALTPTEMAAAHDAGADFVKLFPAASLGSGYLKAIHAPLNHVRILAVGGITEDNLREFIDAGACGAGVGGNLANKEWIRAGRFDKITEAAKKYVSIVK